MDALLFVPVRAHDLDGAPAVVRTARPGAGQERVGLAFTGEERLHAALGPTQRWIRLSRPALLALLRPLEIEEIRVDPLYVGPEMPRMPEEADLPAMDVDADGPVLAGVPRHVQWLPDEVW
ncbi:SAV_915 family protein [Streptomyces sp. NPDC058739]|uniref:SAV_915 family protein n=1 Tax=Streptomyces sp. NPDC058739 TaxID=3346618 RepID=UPI003676773A